MLLKDLYDDKPTTFGIGSYVKLFAPTSIYILCRVGLDTIQLLRLDGQCYLRSSMSVSDPSNLSKDDVKILFENSTYANDWNTVELISKKEAAKWLLAEVKC